MSESAGVTIGATGLALFAGAVTAAVTRRLDDVVMWAFGQTYESVFTATVLVAVFCLCFAWSRQIRSHADDDPDSSVAGAIIHEGHGHAAVGRGVGIRIRKVTVDACGGGMTYYHPGDWRRATPAQRLACNLAGEIAAGPAGCRSDRKNYAAELRNIPRRDRPAVEAEAQALVRQHVGSSFGRRVARTLETKGVFR